MDTSSGGTRFSARMLLIVLVCCLPLATTGQQEDDDWLDPYDMLNYDANTKTMRKPAEPPNYPNVPATRGEQENSSPAELTACNKQVADLQRKIEDRKKRMLAISQQPTCNPVFTRFLNRLLKEIRRVGVPSDSTDVLYDAKVRLSRQAVSEIETLLKGEDSWRTGALDTAISQILVDFRPHDHVVWKWRFEDYFGVDLDTVLKIGLFVLIIMAIICTQLWSTVSWLIQFRRLFTVCFFVSIIWNWFYLYKIAFAEHQNNMAKMDSVNDKCTGVKKIDWTDSLKEWFRSTWTLQDDPCKRYYEVLMVNPILLVPPTKAISVTMTTFITEPLKHFGQGISEFLRALLKDLPITLQIPVLITIVFSILIVLYGGVQAAFRYGITAPLRRHRRDQPPPELEQPQPPLQRIQELDLAGRDAPQHAPRHRANDGRLQRNQVRQRPNRAREEPAMVVVETLRNVTSSYSEDEADGERRDGSPEAEQRENNLSAPESDSQAESNSENEQETQEELTGASVSVVARSEAKTKPFQLLTKHTERDSSQSKTKPLKDEPSRVRAASKSPHVRRLPSRTPTKNVQGLDASAGDATSPVSLTHIDTVGVPVQETSPTSTG